MNITPLRLYIECKHKISFMDESLEDMHKLVTHSLINPEELLLLQNLQKEKALDLCADNSKLSEFSRNILKRDIETLDNLILKLRGLS